MSEVPAYALLCWADSTTLYVQVSDTVIHFPLASGGFSKALPLLQRNFESTPRPIAIPAQAHNPHKARIDEILRKHGLFG